jgi:oxygen-independent coproporphyrinogen-3 oxidase
MSSIYVHIPFCKQACHYCDFHFSTGRHDMKEMTEALQKEIVLQKDYLLGEPVETIYFGGGTPSFIDPGDIRALLLSIRNHFNVVPEVEITLEANPDDIGASTLDQWLGAGVNRLSVGIQTFDDQLLKYLNRAHHSASAQSCLELIRRSGFTNVSLDLIYGIPGLSMQGWSQALETAISYRPSHWSAYA